MNYATHWAGLCLLLLACQTPDARDGVAGPDDRADVSADAITDTSGEPDDDDTLGDTGPTDEADTAASQVPPTPMGSLACGRWEGHDVDGDDVCAGVDNCSKTDNHDQLDTDGDGRGDACDDDIDGDGAYDSREIDELGTDPTVFDTDGDGVGDLGEVQCGTDPLDPSDADPGPCSVLDFDGDGIPDADDNCMYYPNPDQANADGVGHGDLCDCLELLGVSPTLGSTLGKDVLSLFGACFVPGMNVFFGDVPADLVGWPDWDMWVSTPPGEAGTTVDVTVQTPQGDSATLPDAFTYADIPRLCPLELHTIVPNSGSLEGGEHVTVVGRCLKWNTRVTVGGVPVERMRRTTTNALMFEVPPGVALGPVDVELVRYNGVSLLVDDAFTYVDTPAGPWWGPCTLMVGAVAPATGSLAGGTEVSVVGDCFPVGATVSFGAIPATDVDFKTRAVLVATSPPAVNPGPVDVHVHTPAGDIVTLPAAFTYE